MEIASTRQRRRGAMKEGKVFDTVTTSDGQTRPASEFKIARRTGKPRPADTYRAARVPSARVKVRDGYLHVYDRATWRSVQRAGQRMAVDRWPGIGDPNAMESWRLLVLLSSGTTQKKRRTQRASV